MINNHILRSLRFTLDLKDEKAAEIFALGGMELEMSEVHSLLKKETEEGYQECPEDELRAFLDGLILYKRGPAPEKAEPPAIQKLDNNLILKKIRVALELKEEDLIEALSIAGIEISGNELRAFFRKPGHRNYRECRDQFLRNFLAGLSKKMRGRE